jgi:hypothetical protein
VVQTERPRKVGCIFGTWNSGIFFRCSPDSSYHVNPFILKMAQAFLLLLLLLLADVEVPWASDDNFLNVIGGVPGKIRGSR